LLLVWESTDLAFANDYQVETGLRFPETIKWSFVENRLKGIYGKDIILELY